MVSGKAQISPQYIRKNPITVTILEVINPAHFIVKESAILNASSEAKDFVECEESMQKYYESIEPCFFQLPLKDAIIVVLHQKKFYRARVIRILNLSAGHLFKVYLVDYGQECSVPRNCIYQIEKDFLDHPFQAVELKLLGIEPISLVMDSSDLSMTYGPVTYWDPSAAIYIHDLQKGMCNAFIEVKAVDEQCIYGSLFICYENTMKSINDELILNAFARFDKSCWEKVHKIEDLLENTSTNPVVDKSLMHEQLSPKQMSCSSQSSDSEPVFTDLITTLIRPSDGKVVATSSFAKGLASASSSKVQDDNLKQQVQEKSEGVSPVVSSEKSLDEKAILRKKFEMLQQLNRRRRSKQDCQSSFQDTVKKSPVVVESTILEENPSSNVSTNKIETTAVKLSTAEDKKAQKGSIPSCKSSNINSDDIRQSSATNMVCTASESESKEESDLRAINRKRFEKLQQLNRKRRSAPGCQSSFQDAASKSPAVAESTVKVNATENVKTLKDSISLHNSSNPDNFSQSSATNIVSAASGNESEKETDRRSINRKKFEMIQQVNRRRRSIPGYQNSLQVNISKCPAVIKEPVLKENPSSAISSDKIETIPVKLSTSETEKTQKNSISSSNSSNVNSCNHSQSKATTNVFHTVSENASKQENVSQDKSIARRYFEKQQLRNRMKRQSCQSHSQDTVNKNPSTVLENLDIKANSSSSVCTHKIENTPINSNTSERTQCMGITTSKPIISDDNIDVNSNNLRNIETTIQNEIVSAANKSPKQETKPVVVSRNLAIFQKLQERVRKKKLQSVAASEKSSDDLKKIEDNFQAKCSISPSNNSALISTKCEELVLNPCMSLPGKGLSGTVSPLQKSSPPSVKQQEPKSCEEITFMTSTMKTSCNKSGSPVSITDTSRGRTTEKTSDSSKNCVDLDDLDISPMEPTQSEILNELLALSDSDDLLCSISKKQDETFCDKNDVEENFIELSTQLKHFDPKLDFNELSLWEKQEVPALILGLNLIRPVFSVEEARFSKHVYRVLKGINFYGPSCIQSVIWPCMAKNRCMFAVAPPHSGKTVSYVLPLVSNFTEKKKDDKIKQVDKVKQVHFDKGPTIIIVCSSWLKAQAVYDLFHFFLRSEKMNIITLCTDGGNYKTKLLSLINNCDVLIATPYCLVQFLEKINLARLENFILDDGTALMDNHKKELKEILLSYMHAAKRNLNSSQLILFAERYNKNFQLILERMMSNPLIFFTSFLESAVYRKLSIFAHVCEPEGKKSALLGVLKEAGKVIICTTTKDNAVDVHHFLRCEDVRTFLVHEDMEHYIVDGVIKDWKSLKSCYKTSSHCLVITDQALIKMCISNADCLVHYDIPPESRLQFGNRFSYIAEHFQENNPACVCHILITESEKYYAPRIVEIIKNSGGTPPKELLELSEKQDQVESTSGILCPYLKAFGFCKERLCKDRHIIDAEIDKPQVVPREGDIQGLVTQVIDASHYYVRLLKYLDPVSNKTVSLIGTYAEIGFKLKDLYRCASDEMKVESPVVGENYVLAIENNLFYRIKILKEVNPDSSTVLPSWKVLFLDEGWIKYYEKPRLYKLSDQIKLPEPLAVEVYVCNISTPDSCFDWNPQTSQLVSDFIKDKEIHGKIALCLGRTLWLDPIALILHLSNTNEFITLFKLNQKLLECGHVKQNKNHLINLRKACEGKICLPHIAKASVKKEEKVAEQVPVISYAFLECNRYEDVYVSSVISPHQLYVQRAKFVQCLDNLLDKINEQIESRTLKKAYTLYKGMHCIAPFYEDDRYYRAVITDVISYTEVQLFYVDFGDSSKAPRNNIYCLPAEFLLLPFQAIECELAGVTAAHGGWTDSAADALKTLTRDEAGDMKILQLQAYNKTSCYGGGNHYVIDLWFNEKNLSEQLLQAGFGVPAEVPTVVSFPTKSQDSSSEHSSDEEFNLNEKKLSSDEDMHPDDKDAAALFYGYVAEMVMQTSNLIPKPGVTITEVSSDDEKCMNKSNGTSKFSAEKVCNDLMKLLPKIDQSNKNGTSLEPCSNSLKPLIIWWDTAEQLSILINLTEVKMYQLVVTDEGFNFNTIIAGAQYSADEKFYDEIHSSNARKYQTLQGINIVAKKRTPFKWPRFTKEKKKFLHIKYDLFHIDDSDSDAEEQSIKAKRQIMQKERAMDEDSSSTDEEEKYVEPWKDFAQHKSSYSTFD